ncbi:MAG TPA: hypothetical protein VGI71_16285 [Scandinavium sp.]
MKKAKKVAAASAALIACCLIVACSNVLTYIRHDERKGNIQCSDDQALKRDSQCNVNTK